VLKPIDRQLDTPIPGCKEFVNACQTTQLIETQTMAEVNLMDLPVTDLKKVYDSFEEEVKQLNTYMRTLSAALERFSASNSCLEQLKTQESGM
jgi:hypothetical protein